LIKKTDKQKTKAILDIFEPIELPTASTVLFWSADLMDIDISGAEVAIPIIKKLAVNPEIEYADENRSVDATRRLDPSNNSANPRTKINIDSIMTDEYYIKYLYI
tara:strand:+ start:249 stop:563 length:315 start_codon:yes stop_codon:yes gene_type:complete